LLLIFFEREKAFYLRQMLLAFFFLLSPFDDEKRDGKGQKLAGWRFFSNESLEALLSSGRGRGWVIFCFFNRGSWGALAAAMSGN